MKLQTMVFAGFLTAGVWAAPITMLDVPDSTKLYDSTDPFAITVATNEVKARAALGTSLSNALSAEVSSRAALGTAVSNGIAAVGAYAYSPTNPPPVAGSPNFSTNAYTVTGPQSNLIATALQSETDAIALAALAQYAATAVVSRVMVSSNSWYTFAPGTATLWTVIDYNSKWTLTCSDLYQGATLLLPAGTHRVIGMGYPAEEGVYEVYGTALDVTIQGPNVGLSPGWLSPAEYGFTSVSIGSLEGFSGTVYLEYNAALGEVTTNAVPFPLPTTSQISYWDAKIDSTNGILHNATATGTFTLNGSPLGLGMTTNNVDDRVRLLAPTNSPTFTGAITLTNGTSFAAGVLNGTNGVSFTRLGTNYWILLP